MTMAIEMARQGIAAGQAPFGTVIVHEGKVVAASHDTVWRDVDPTAHAEINAIRQAAGALKSVALRGGTLYTTCEPCPMCLAAIHWSQLDRVVHGTRLADAAAAGFHELNVEAATLVKLGGSSVRVEGDVMRDECVGLFARWREAGRSGSY